MGKKILIVSDDFVWKQTIRKVLEEIQKHPDKHLDISKTLEEEKIQPPIEPKK